MPLAGIAKSIRQVGEWAGGGGSTKIVNRRPRGGSHYDPKGSRRDVKFVPSSPTYRKPGSVVAMPTANPHTRNNPARPAARMSVSKSPSPSPGRVLTPSPRVSLHPAPAATPRTPTQRTITRGAAAIPGRLSASAEASFRAGSRSSPGANYPNATPPRIPGSAAHAADRTRASEFTSAQKGHDRRVLAEGRGKYSSADDPVGARMREAQRGLTKDIAGNVGEILMYGVEGGMLAGAGGIGRAAMRRIAKPKPLNLSLPQKPLGIRATPSLRPPRPELPTPPPARGIQYKPPGRMRIGSASPAPARAPGIRMKTSSSKLGIRQSTPPTPAAKPAPKPARKAAKKKAKKKAAVKGRQRN